MTIFKQAAFDGLLAKIDAIDTDQRHIYSQQLDAGLEAMRQAGLPIKADLKDLADMLRDESVEAQFDNLPI